MTRQQAGVSAEAVAKLVAKWRSSEWAYAHLGPACDKPTEEICADELEALATAPPEQAILRALGATCSKCGHVHISIVCTCGCDISGTLLMPPPQPVSAGALADAISYFKIEADARFGLSNWRNKPHNEKWWKRIDGTPIPNDLVVCIAEEISKQLARTLAAHDQKVRSEKPSTHDEVQDASAGER